MAVTGAYDWFRTIAAVLGDDEPNRPFQRYPLKDLVAAFNRGASIVHKYRPDLFTETRKVKLVAGSNQQALGCFDNVLEILAQVDKNGGIIKRLTSTKDAKKTKGLIKNTWKKPSCIIRTDENNTEIPYEISYAIVEDGMNGHFVVEPPVPCDTDAFILAKGIIPLPTLDLNDVLQGGQFEFSEFHLTCIWHYILFSMLIGDRHATGAVTEAFNHNNMFFNYLAIELKQEMAVKRGEII